MSNKEYSSYQRDVIQRYYENLDAIKLGVLQELVTDLFLAKDGPKEDRLWERAEMALVQLKVPKKILEHIMQKRRVEILAEHVQDWLKKKG